MRDFRPRGSNLYSFVTFVLTGTGENPDQNDQYCEHRDGRRYPLGSISHCLFAACRCRAEAALET
jgi:hypothetical protein